LHVEDLVAVSGVAVVAAGELELIGETQQQERG